MNASVSPIQQLRLRRFVNREQELQTFSEMLEHPAPDRPISLVWGGGGMGKSSLLDRMEQESVARSLLSAKAVWTETRNYDYLSFMRKIRDDLGSERFSFFNDRVNFFTVPHYKMELVVHGTVQVGAGMRNSGSVGSVTGVAVQDNNISVPRADMGIPEAERMTQLTDAFLWELNAFAADQPVVLFLDAFEKASSITQRWVGDELLGAVLDGRIARVRIVICGRMRPDWDEDRWTMTNEMKLAPLCREHVVEYIQKSHLNIPANAITIVADTLVASSCGVPHIIANTLSVLSKQWAQNQAA